MVVVTGKGIASDSNQPDTFATKSFGKDIAKQTPPLPNDDDQLALQIVSKDTISKNSHSVLMLTDSRSPESYDPPPNSMALVVKPNVNNEFESKEVDLPPDGVHKVWGVRFCLAHLLLN